MSHPDFGRSARHRLRQSDPEEDPFFRIGIYSSPNNKTKASNTLMKRLLAFFYGEKTTVATFLKALMTLNSVTTWDIASALQKSQSHVSQIVSGRREPSKYEASIIAALVGWTDLGVLFPGTFSGQSNPQEESK